MIGPSFGGGTMVIKATRTSRMGTVHQTSGMIVVSNVHEAAHMLVEARGISLVQVWLKMSHDSAIANRSGVSAPDTV